MTCTSGDGAVIDLGAPTVNSTKLWSSNLDPAWASTGDTITAAIAFNDDVEMPLVHIAGQEAHVTAAPGACMGPRAPISLAGCFNQLSGGNAPGNFLKGTEAAGTRVTTPKQCMAGMKGEYSRGYPLYFLQNPNNTCIIGIFGGKPCFLRSLPLYPVFLSSRNLVPGRLDHEVEIPLHGLARKTQ